MSPTQEALVNQLLDTGKVCNVDALEKNTNTEYWVELGLMPGITVAIPEMYKWELDGGKTATCGGKAGIIMELKITTSSVNLLLSEMKPCYCEHCREQLVECLLDGVAEYVNLINYSGAKNSPIAQEEHMLQYTQDVADWARERKV